MKHLCEKRILQSKHYFASLGDITSRSQFGGYSIAANKIIFALVSGGELYLRASKKDEQYFHDRNMPHLIYTKRGMPVPLNYYLVDESLWENTTQLLRYARMSLSGAQQDKAARNQCVRLKDLPNLNHDLERLLWKVGIKNIDELQQYGAKSSYLKLRAISANLSVNILLALAGAICGMHQAALPTGIRNELLEWYESNVVPSFKRHKH
ncbi:competence-specific regulator [Brenneria goodwinii]|uniref:Competence-specific regulator n=1 Tax=Brenneria goodwinii TaxID=1109412 RepID=A0A0G4JZ36_9GAMM|nr:TfoX/Sxy family DNA transformation protein [Brenneria goodwinii]ATA23561.1 competence-specific regulator [Brenneria goodwinii]MCG8154803.1 TfoX/Sxy family DNA transformation protein [Brenneria goodwinii]MCG8159860.1 TfoX/Sxy family DNA transformation protein [Brenneria goodwinii]MCG8164041.1 TfoX/Sxy family DNA transformation protein [Brenneria goodwinii]MCG8168650.1 TfoX/Sxy family DNA transformation protein [Brenneria goodwinii]